jgi:hypothetical protein
MFALNICPIYLFELLILVEGMMNDEGSKVIVRD